MIIFMRELYLVEPVFNVYNNIRLGRHMEAS